MEKKKNVLLICVDQWPGALMQIAGKKEIMTPTLDGFARDGVRFTNCISTCPVCIPARRSLMTGTYPASHGDRVYSVRMEMPPFQTLAESFDKAGYQSFAVGKLHVFPQRNRIGFDDVTLMEEGRCDFGVVDDYQIWLGEHGFTGQEFMHAMGNNTYYTRPWHLPEAVHPTVWGTREMCKQIKRKDPTRPAFFYMSYQFPHPPLVPLQSYLDMYDENEIDLPVCGDWVDDSTILKLLQEKTMPYDKRDIILAKKAFYAQCTLIDHQIRLLIGTLRECNLLDDTIIGFVSDHGDSLFDHKLVAKRTFYEGSAKVPFIITGKPMAPYRGLERTDVISLEDVMPTLLDLCGIEIPSTVEGIPLFSEKRHDMIYGEVSEGLKATRMVCDNRYKLIYYPCGNVFQFFDLENDPRELHNLHGVAKTKGKEELLCEYLVSQLYGSDLDWVKDGKLIGFEAGVFEPKADYGLYNQRGYHWPPSNGFSNGEKNA